MSSICFVFSIFFTHYKHSYISLVFLLFGSFGILPCESSISYAVTRYNSGGDLIKGPFKCQEIDAVGISEGCQCKSEGSFYERGYLSCFPSADAKRDSVIQFQDGKYASARFDSKGNKWYLPANYITFLNKTIVTSKHCSQMHIMHAFHMNATTWTTDTYDWPFFVAQNQVTFGYFLKIVTPIEVKTFEKYYQGKIYMLDIHCDGSLTGEPHVLIVKFKGTVVYTDHNPVSPTPHAPPAPPPATPPAPSPAAPPATPPATPPNTPPAPPPATSPAPSPNTPPATPPPKSGGSSSSNTILIVGIAAAGVVVLLLVIVFIYCCIKRRKEFQRYDDSIKNGPFTLNNNNNFRTDEAAIRDSSNTGKEKWLFDVNSRKPPPVPTTPRPQIGNIYEYPVSAIASKDEQDMYLDVPDSGEQVYSDLQFNNAVAEYLDLTPTPKRGYENMLAVNADSNYQGLQSYEVADNDYFTPDVKL